MHHTDRPGESPRGSWRDALRGWSSAVLLALLVVTLVRALVVQQFVVTGPSMQTTFAGGERVAVNRLAYRFGEPVHGDVVVADVPGVVVIKRVVAVGGQSVAVSGCQVLVDGEVLREGYLPAPGRGSDAAGCGPSVGELRVPSGHVFLLGDNRGVSSDSRMFGTVPVSSLVGRVDAVLWPPSAWSMP